MSIIIRTIFIAALSGLIFLPLAAGNRSADSPFAATGVNATRLSKVNAWSARLDESSSDILARLGVLKSEIHADLCAHGARHYCAAGLCLKVPLGGCAQK